MSKYTLCPEHDAFRGEGDTLLDALNDARVLEVEPYEDGARLREACDRYFNVVLSAEQLRALALELVQLADEIDGKGATL